MQSTDHVAVDWAAFTVRVPEIFAFSVNRPYNHPKTPDGQFTSTVDMKERNSTSTLKRILVTCAAQGKEYGGCVAAKVPQVERDMCLKEFLALKSCMQNVLRGKA
ncbi:PREDICTED: unnamed [Prunus dulcis]|uniref:PREDICTED: unnamed n=1 Tax=Prunus dulcis TaxID=3755 RepID=A0A5E4GFC7_PRUDU|nr:PREDICTED: unnamed [Prunus dulcis]